MPLLTYKMRWNQVSVHVFIWLVIWLIVKWFVIVLLVQWVSVVNNVSCVYCSHLTDRSQHPYCAPSWQAFLGWNVGKRRAAEVTACSVQQCFSTFCFKQNPLQQFWLLTQPMGIARNLCWGHLWGTKAERPGNGSWGGSASPLPPVRTSGEAP